MAEELQRIDNRTDLWVNNKCDKFDYLTAAFCGGMAGLIDVIFVQSPDSSKSGTFYYFGLCHNPRGDCNIYTLMGLK